MNDYFELISDLPYRTIGETTLRLDLYCPVPRPEAPLPCAVFFFGGGWVEGDKKDIRRFEIVTEPLLRAGIAVAAPQYRFVSRGGCFPGCVEDAQAAMSYLEKQDAVPIDPDRKAVFGISSGGYLSLMCALYHSHDFGFRPLRAVVDMCGPSLLREDKGIRFSPFLKNLCDNFLADSASADAEPLRLVRAAHPLTKFLILHGQEDDIVPIGMSRLLADALNQNGIDVTLTEVENATHFFKASDRSRPTAPDGKTLYKSMSDFIIENI